MQFAGLGKNVLQIKQSKECTSNKAVTQKCVDNIVLFITSSKRESVYCSSESSLLTALSSSFLGDNICYTGNMESVCLTCSQAWAS